MHGETVKCYSCVLRTFTPFYFTKTSGWNTSSSNVCFEYWS